MGEMLNKIPFRFILTIAVGLLIVYEAEGGNDRSAARLVGMARVHAAAALGVDAIGLNPALLSYPRGYAVEASTLPLGIRFGSNFLDYNLYSTYFTGVDDPVSGDRIPKHLSPEDEQNILDSFRGGKGTINADVHIRWLAAAYRETYFGGLGFAVSDRFALNFSMPDDYIRMLFTGFTEEGNSYDFSGTEGRTWWIREYAAAYATPRYHLIVLDSWFPWVSFGAGIKLVHGYAYFGTESYEGFISNKGLDEGFVITGEMEVRTRRASADFIHDAGTTSFHPLRGPSGIGWGVDLGIAVGVTQDLTAGLSITDIGAIRWRKNTYGSTGSGRIMIDDVFSSEQRDSLLNTYTGTDERISPFTTPLPAALRAGASLQMNDALMIAADYTQGFNSMPANSVVPRFAVGAEWLPFTRLPIRSGVAVGGFDGFTWAFGAGLHFTSFTVDIATENIGLLFFPNTTKHISFALSTKFRF